MTVSSEKDTMAAARSQRSPRERRVVREPNRWGFSPDRVGVSLEEEGEESPAPVRRQREGGERRGDGIG